MCVELKKMLYAFAPVVMHYEDFSYNFMRDRKRLFISSWSEFIKVLWEIKRESSLS